MNIFGPDFDIIVKNLKKFGFQEYLLLAPS